MSSDHARAKRRPNTGVRPFGGVRGLIDGHLAVLPGAAP